MITALGFTGSTLAVELFCIETRACSWLKGEWRPQSHVRLCEVVAPQMIMRGSLGSSFPGIPRTDAPCGMVS